MCRSEQGKPPMKLASDSCVREAFGSANFVFFFLFLFVGKGKSFAYEQEIFLKFAFFFLSRKLECLMSGKFMTWLDGKCVVNILMLRKSNLAKFNSCYCFRKIFKLRRFSFCGFFHKLSSKSMRLLRKFKKFRKVEVVFNFSSFPVTFELEKLWEMFTRLT